MSRAKLGLSMGRNLTSGSPLAIIIWDDGSYKTWSIASSSLPLPLSPFHLLSPPFSNNSVQPTTTTCTSRLLLGRSPARRQQQLQVGDSRDTSVPRRKPPNAPGVSNHSDLVAPSASLDLFHLASSKSRLSASLPLASLATKGNKRPPPHLDPANSPPLDRGKISVVHSPLLARAAKRRSFRPASRHFDNQNNQPVSSPYSRTKTSKRGIWIPDTAGPVNLPRVSPPSPPALSTKPGRAAGLAQEPSPESCAPLGPARFVSFLPPRTRDDQC